MLDNFFKKTRKRQDKGNCCLLISCFIIVFQPIVRRFLNGSFYPLFPSFSILTACKNTLSRW